MSRFCSHFSFEKRRISTQTLSLTTPQLSLESYFFRMKTTYFEHINKENTKLANKSFTQNQLFEFNNHPSLDELFGLALENKKFLIEPKESI